MTLTVTVQEAKVALAELLVKVGEGEEVIITRAGVPVARLTGVGALPPRQFGTMALELPEGFFDPLPEGELHAWE